MEGQIQVQNPQMQGSFFHRLRVQRGMMRDVIRTELYRKAIFERVKPGDVVLDFGAGSGILSIFAAKAGARKVYAVERTSIVKIASELLHKNGLEDRVELINADMETADLPEKVDLIVSDWMGGYGVDENALPPLLVARDRYLKPGGVILPERVTAWMTPVWDSRRDHDLNFWRQNPYEVDLSLISDYTAHEYFWDENSITEDTVLAKPQPMWTTDVYKCSVEEARSSFKTSLSFLVNQKGKLSSLAAWFSADFGKGLILTNAPDAPKTCWGRSIFPLERTVKVEPGTPIAVEFTLELSGIGCCHNTWSVRVGEGDWEHHDSRKALW